MSRLLPEHFRNVVISLAVFGAPFLMASDKQPSVTLLPLGLVPAATLNSIITELPKALPVKASIGVARGVPEKTRSKYRPSRYRADDLLEFLSTLPEAKEAHVLGLLEADISCTKGDFPDWGIFGLGFCPGPTAVVSTFRLKRNVWAEKRIFRIVCTAIHETGHMLGLKHCEEPRCVMLDAEGSISNTDTSTGQLGPGCRTILVAKFGEW